MSGIIFSKLIERATERGEVIANADQGRWIKPLEAEDAKEADLTLMTKAEIGILKVTRHVRAIQIDDGDRRLFGFFGLPPIEALPEGLIEIELTPGIFALAVTELDIRPVGSPYEIKELLEREFLGVAEYNGHELSQVARLYPKLFVAESVTGSEYCEDIQRVLGAVLANSYLDGPLAFNSETLELVGDMFINGNEYIPFDKVLQGFLSISWGGFFVELYRCIEHLFPASRLIDLREEWKSEKSLSEIARLLESHLAWRPKEDESINKMVNHCGVGVVAALEAAFNIKSEADSRVEQIAKAIYATRNSLVHFRAGLSAGEKSDTQWNAIISAMIYTISDVYNGYGGLFLAVPPKPAAA